MTDDTRDDAILPEPPDAVPGETEPMPAVEVPAPPVPASGEAVPFDAVRSAADPLGTETVAFDAIEPAPDPSTAETTLLTAIPAAGETAALPAVESGRVAAARSRAATGAAKRKARRKALVWVGAILLVIVLGSLAYAAWSVNRIEQRLRPAAAVTQQINTALVPPPPKSEPLYILLMGDDRRPKQGRQRSDTMLLARLDREKKTIALLSIPRDTRVNIPKHGLDKINAAYSYGGPGLAIETVKEFTGLPVHHYLEVDFIGLTKVVDAMGGLTINVDRTINDRHGDVAGVGSVTHIDKGVQKMDGETALTYVRSRNFAEGDLVRIHHQQTFLKALAKQALEPSKTTKVPAILNSVSANMKTDMNLGELTSLAMEFKGATDDMKTYTISGKGTMINRIWYLVVDEADYRRIMNAYTSGEATASASWR